MDNFEFLVFYFLAQTLVMVVMSWWSLGIVLAAPWAVAFICRRSMRHLTQHALGKVCLAATLGGFITCYVLLFGCFQIWREDVPRDCSSYFWVAQYAVPVISPVAVFLWCLRLNKKRRQEGLPEIMS